MSLKNKSVLVTGGAGFIGSHLVDRLTEENPEKIVVVDNFFIGKQENLNYARKKNSNLIIINQDSTNEEAMEKIIKDNDFDVVFHLAVLPLPLSLAEPKNVFWENIKMTIPLCEFARKDYFKTLIHFSSSEVYGTAKYTPMDEKHYLFPLTPYAASKVATDQLVLSYYNTFGIDTSIVRPFNNYGPRQNEEDYAAVIPLTIKRILSGDAPVLYGDGNQTRDYIYVTDTADATIEVYNHKNTRGKVLNIASGKETSINYLIRIIAKHLNCTKPIVYEKTRPGDVRRHVANIYLAEDLIGFKPTVSLEEGLRWTIDWYKEKLIKGQSR